MFVYAAARALADRLGATLYIDTSRYAEVNRPDRPLELGAFGIKWSEVQLPPYSPQSGMQRLATWLRLTDEPFRDFPILHFDEGFDTAFNAITGSCTILGNFQSWRYFAGHEAAIRATFDIDRLASPRIAPVEAEIAAAALPVAVHVRRGDYTRSAERIAKLGMLSRPYYDLARATLERATGRPSPTYFLFSDEPEVAAKELVGWSNLRPVSGFSALEEFRLMASCRHFITANSTFSWWAAWLGRATDKQVLAPRQWFGPAFEKPVDPLDRLVPGWIGIDNAY
ncbi:MAG TPA: alpha-1,2-fucosyltransferase [Rhizobiaceae bacterium]|nr:alpha-1,2-fucosyltransferase [Rhizobiaceae bacterium]